jgi:hypothetical protein
MLKLRSVLLALAATVLIVRPALSQKVAIFTPTKGSEYCESYNSSIGNAHINYIYGYISAAAIFSGKDNLRGLSVEDIINYVNRYCRAHPEDTILRAADQLFETRAGRQ